LETCKKLEIESQEGSSDDNSDVSEVNSEILSDSSNEGKMRPKDSDYSDSDSSYEKP
jgi:hypothetical protein